MNLHTNMFAWYVYIFNAYVCSFVYRYDVSFDYVLYVIDVISSPPLALYKKHIIFLFSSSFALLSLPSFLTYYSTYVSSLDRHKHSICLKRVYKVYSRVYMCVCELFPFSFLQHNFISCTYLDVRVLKQLFADFLKL